LLFKFSWSKILPIKFFKSEWSFAQFRIPELKSICAFGDDNKLIGIIINCNILVISADGKYYQASFDPKSGGQCIEEQQQNLNIGAKTPK
jgi:selenophosphate synthetase-related protein